MSLAQQMNFIFTESFSEVQQQIESSMKYNKETTNSDLQSLQISQRDRQVPPAPKIPSTAPQPSQRIGVSSLLSLPSPKTTGPKPHHPIHEQTLQLVHQERQITGQVIANLQIIADQKLYLKMAYGSLFDYCTQYLKYSESCAYRRIAAAKVIKEMPQIIEPLNSGALSLTNLTQAQVLFKQKPTLSTENKQQILQSLENKSKKQAEQILRQHLPDPKVTADQERFIDADHLELKIQIRHSTHQKLQRLRQLRSHKNPQMSYDELLSDMADLLLKKMDPLMKADPEVKKNIQDAVIKKDSMPNSQLKKNGVFGQDVQSAANNSCQQNAHIEQSRRNTTIVDAPTTGAKVLRQKNKKPKHIRFIPQAIKTKIWQRGQGTSIRQYAIRNTSTYGSSAFKPLQLFSVS
ncbi:MAG: hypothetical protein ACOYOK_16380 [Pseudobdellovibrionaceae bacterium]